MTKRDWNEQRTVGMFLNGQKIDAPGPHGEKVEDESFLLLFNAHHHAMTFTLPTEAYGRMWQVVVDTADPLRARAARKERDAKPGGRLRIPARSLLVLQRRF